MRRRTVPGLHLPIGGPVYAVRQKQPSRNFACLLSFVKLIFHMTLMNEDSHYLLDLKRVHLLHTNLILVEEKIIIRHQISN